jgi:hypothetical protein
MAISSVKKYANNSYRKKVKIAISTIFSHSKIVEFFLYGEITNFTMVANPSPKKKK